MGVMLSEMKKWAIAGVTRRLAEVEAERKSLLSFLSAMKEGLEKKVNIPAYGAGPDLAKVREVVKKKRRGMSPAKRRAASERMKKFWAERRKAKAQKGKKKG